jgi:predicted class III extradiol MEMO1 family dioxygenase
MNLDLSIYYNFFNIDSSKKSLELYEKIKLFNIIFLHSTADYKKKINLTTYIDRFVNDENNIIISADYNIYNNEHDKYELAQEYVNQLVPYYIDILKNAQYIYIVDSCFSCIVLPLSYRNELNAIEYKIFDRNSIVT